ncbi:MAG: hypothetical protein IJD22_01675, partial [Clostridia bacterium]|nr:hypothetical protein [Clostridia bacterium]
SCARVGTVVGTEPEMRNSEETELSVVILSADGGVGRTVSQYIGADLSDKGMAVCYQLNEGKEPDGMIAV